MADMIKFYRGSVGSLPAAGDLGALYITTDEGAIYYGTGTSMKRLGDFIQVDAVANLPTDGANTSALYYCVAENVLAKWNGATWVQVNKQKTADELKEFLGLGSLAYLSAVAEDNLASDLKTKINNAATKAYVGDIPEGYTEETVIAYIDKKAAETLSSATGGSSESAASVLAALNDYKDENDPKVQANTDAITAIKDGTSIDSFADVESAINGVQADVDSVAESIGEVAEGKTVVEMIADAQAAATYDDTEVRGLISDNSEAIDAIEADYLKAADKTALNDAIALKADKTTVDGIDGRVAAIEEDYLKAADKTELTNADAAQVTRIAALEGQITGLTGAMHFKGVETEIPTGDALASYADGDVIIVGDKEYVFNSGAFVEFGDVSAEGERIADLESAVDAIEADYLKAADKTELQGNINKKADQTAVDAIDGRVATIEGDYLKAADKTELQNAITAEANTARAAEKANADAIAAIKDDENIDSFADVVAELAKKQNTGDYATKAEAQAMADAKDAAIAAAKSAADTAQAEVDALEKTHATDKAAIDASIAANTEAIATKANAADVYAKTETYTKAEVESLIETAHTWGSF